MVLIQVKQNADGQSVVSARELHTFLEVQTRFDIWIDRRVKEYGFVENQDYVLVAQKRTTNNPKNPSTSQIDYAVTIDMAKELSMVERTQRGRQARLYFIKCEKELKTNLAIEAGKLYALLNKLEKVWLTFALAKKQMEDVDCGFNELAQGLEELPTASPEPIQEPNSVFMTVAEFFKQKCVELSMEDIAYYNRFCKNYARIHKLRTASGGSHTIAFTLPTLEEAWKKYKATQSA